MEKSGLEVYEERMKVARERAHGHWDRILEALGNDPKVLKRRNMPCPLCGGTDRFQYTDKWGEGNYHCRKCGPGGGFKLLQGMHHWSNMEVLKEVEAFLSIMPAASRPVAAAGNHGGMRRLAERIWKESVPVSRGDEVDVYLRSRGLGMDRYPQALRYHKALGYYEYDAGSSKSRLVASYPAMVACIRGSDDRGLAVHRTYLPDGRKLDLPGTEARKHLGAENNGGAVRLGEAGPVLAVGEGIENTLVALLDSGLPSWAGLSATNLEKLWIPDSVQELVIYADNDAPGDFTGQAAAYALARRFCRNSAQSGRKARVKLPDADGQDWNDVWLQRSDGRAAA